MASSKCLRHEDYTVGWVSALPLELAAATKMLDEIHQSLLQDPSDTNTYTLGTIGKHNVVLACLPAGQIGTNSAAKVATLMRWSFKSLRFCLLVGIGGGVPSANADIRLGDVVVSQPNLGRGGVIQYDFGKSTPSGFERTGQQTTPPELLLSALAKLQSLHFDGKSNPSSHSFRSDQIANLQDPPAADLLFEANYAHLGGISCEPCDRKRLVKRYPDKARETHIFYGTIASGNQVIRDGVTRDLLSSELGGVLCFEMEAAGIMNSLPFLAIRGICDYADSHKHKMWQPWAASTAAAYARSLLSLVAPEPSRISSTASRSHMLKRFRHQQNSEVTKLDPVEEDYFSLVDRISDYEPDRTHWEYLRHRCPSTTTWILDSKPFRSWLRHEGSSCLWLTGKIGSGKTMLTNTVVEHMSNEIQEKKPLVAHYFFNQSYTFSLEASDLFRSYTKQILRYYDRVGKPYPSEDICPLRRFYGSNASPPTFNEIVDKVFLPLSKSSPSVAYIVDGLDECQADEISRVLKVLRTIISTSQGAQVLVSGRETLHVQHSIQGSSIIQIGNEDVQEDIRDFINWKIEEKTRDRRITDTESLLQDIKSTLIDKADRMILWVSLQVECLWEECLTDSDIRAALASLPKDLNETYARCVKRISTSYKRFAPRILRWVGAAVKPFTIDQLRGALAIDVDTGELDPSQMPTDQDVLRCCANLVTLDGDRHVVFAHHSVRQFLSTSDKELFVESFDLEAARLELGQLCIIHLSSPTYSLAVQRMGADKAVRIPLQASTITRLTDCVPRLLKFGLPKPRRTQPRVLQVTIPRKSNHVSSNTETHPFFHFAREQWLLLTGRINVDCEHWDKFYILALQPNISWRLHPWPPLGQSLVSHYTGLLGWAIANSHTPLWQLLLGPQGPRLTDDIFRIPLYQHNSLPVLHLAVRTGDLMIFKLLLPRCDLLATDLQGRTVLHHAADVGALEIAELALERGLQPEAPDHSGVTALQLAVENGRTYILEVFFTRRLSPESLWYTMHRGLHKAAQHGHEGVIRIILRHGDAEYMLLDEIEISAVSYAAQGGHEIIVKLLLNHAYHFLSRLRSPETIGQMNKKFDATCENAFYWATMLGHSEIAKLILRSWMSLGFEEAIHASGLLTAVHAGNEAVLNFLLENGFNPLAKKHKGSTALHRAVHSNDIGRVKLLLDHGAGSIIYNTMMNMTRQEKASRQEITDAANVAGMPLDDAFRSYFKERIHMAKVGRDLTVDIEAGSSNHSPSIADSRLVGILKILKKHGPNLREKDYAGQTPLHLAILNQNRSATRLLLNAGGYNVIENNNGETPLQLARRLNCSIYLMKMLHTADDNFRFG